MDALATTGSLEEENTRRVHDDKVHFDVVVGALVPPALPYSSAQRFSRVRPPQVTANSSYSLPGGAASKSESHACPFPCAHAS